MLMQKDSYDSLKIWKGFLICHLNFIALQVYIYFVYFKREKMCDWTIKKIMSKSSNKCKKLVFFEFLSAFG